MVWVRVECGPKRHGSRCRRFAAIAGRCLFYINLGPGRVAAEKKGMYRCIIGMCIEFVKASWRVGVGRWDDGKPT